MTSAGLPLICAKCRKCKLPTLGKVQAGYKYNSLRFICFECENKQGINRLTRKGDETPPEREVRQWLQERKIVASAEFTLGKCIYDFAIPQLTLVIELDSRRFHASKRKKIRDAYKDKNAQDHGWTIRRVKIGPHLLFDVERVILQEREKFKV